MDRKKSSNKKRKPSRNTKKMLNIYGTKKTRQKKDETKFYRKNSTDKKSKVSQRHKSSKTDRGLMGSALSNKLKKPSKLGQFERSIYKNPSKSPPVNINKSNKLSNRSHLDKGRLVNQEHRTPRDNLKKDFRNYNKNPSENTYKQLMQNVV